MRPTIERIALMIGGKPATEIDLVHSKFMGRMATGSFARDALLAACNEVWGNDR